MNVHARLSTVFWPPPCAVSTGSFGREATTFYKRLADLISSTQQKHYSNVTSWLRCCLSIAILRSAVMCVGGSCSCHYCPRWEVNISLASSEVFPMYCSQTLSSRVLFLPFICSTSFLSFCGIIQRHCITQFTLCTGVNVWPRQAWLTVPVYTCVLFSFLWSHIDLLFSQY